MRSLPALLYSLLSASVSLLHARVAGVARLWTSWAFLAPNNSLCSLRFAVQPWFGACRILDDVSASRVSRLTRNEGVVRQMPANASSEAF